MSVTKSGIRISLKKIEECQYNNIPQIFIRFNSFIKFALKAILTIAQRALATDLL